MRQPPVILGLTLLAAIPGGSLGFGFQALMPALAEELDTGQRGFGRAAPANGVGAIVGAVILGYVGQLGGQGNTVCVRPSLGRAAGFFSALPFFLLSFAIMLLVGAAEHRRRTRCRKRWCRRSRPAISGVVSWGSTRPRVRPPCDERPAAWWAGHCSRRPCGGRPLPVPGLIVARRGGTPAVRAFDQYFVTLDCRAGDARAEQSPTMFCAPPGKSEDPWRASFASS